MSGRIDDQNTASGQPLTWEGLHGYAKNEVARAAFSACVEEAVDQAQINVINAAAPYIDRAARIDELRRFIRYVEDAGLTVAYQELRGRLSELEADA